MTPTQLSVLRRMAAGKVPLTCTITKTGVLLIRVGIGTIKFATETNPQMTAEDGETPVVTVSDAKVFAHEVCRAMNEESEDGSTLLSRMLDAAVMDAVDNGAQGITYRLTAAGKRVVAGMEGK